MNYLTQEIDSTSTRTAKAEKAMEILQSIWGVPMYLAKEMYEPMKFREETQLLSERNEQWLA